MDYEFAYETKSRPLDETAIKSAAKEGQGSQYYSLLSEMTEAAEVLAISRKQNVEEFECGILRKALDVCTHLYSAFHSDFVPKSNQRPFSVWHHVPDVMALVRKDDCPWIDRSALLQATGEYLKLPIRCPRMDRILVDSLIAVELLSFADEVFGRPTPRRRSC